MNMSAIEAISLLTSSGVFAGGMAALKWALSIERRIQTVELRVQHGQAQNSTT